MYSLEELVSNLAVLGISIDRSFAS